MFFCDPCAGLYDWPVSMFRSYGRCEVCRETASCSDVPSKYLPPAKHPEFTSDEWSDLLTSLGQLARGEKLPATTLDEETE